MHSILRHIALLLFGSAGLLEAQAPRWGFLGDNEGLEATYNDAERVVLVCVYETELRDVRPPFAEVVYHTTVIETYKGELKVGGRIQISFRTDSLPAGDDERRKFVKKANKNNKGSLKFAFLHGRNDGAFSCELMDVPRYSKEMQEFLGKQQKRQRKQQAELDGAEQPATAPESKPEGNEKPQLDSEGRSQ